MVIELSKEKKDENLAMITRAMILAIEGSITNIETVTKALNNSFGGLELEKLPEYRQAIDNIRAYAIAATEKLRKGYDCSGSGENS